MSARYVFIKPPSLDVLKTRLRDRGTEDEVSIKRRLAQAAAELEYADKPGVYDLVIINDNLATAFRELEEFALSTEPLPPKQKTFREKMETWLEVKLRWLH